MHRRTGCRRAGAVVWRGDRRNLRGRRQVASLLLKADGGHQARDRAEPGAGRLLDAGDIGEGERGVHAHRGRFPLMFRGGRLGADQGVLVRIGIILEPHRSVEAVEHMRSQIEAAFVCGTVGLDGNAGEGVPLLGTRQIATQVDKGFLALRGEEAVDRG